MQGGCPIKIHCFVGFLPDLRLIFCPIWLFFANFPMLGGGVAPSPLSLTPMFQHIEISF